MVRTVLAHKKHETYLQKCGDDHPFSYGLIIGQPTEQSKDFIVHLARNLEQDIESFDQIPSEQIVDSSIIRSSQDIDTQGLINQVISATKMLPGCFYILGLFVVSEDNLFDNEVEVKGMKNLLEQVIKVLRENASLCGTSSSIPHESKLLLSYSTKLQKTVCKIYEPKEGAGFLMPVEWKFLDKHTEWHKIESNYELDDVFPIVVEDDNKINIEDNLSHCLKLINSYIKCSEIFIQDQNLTGGTILDSYVKRVENEKGSPIETITANIFLPAVTTDPSDAYIMKFRGSIRFKGVVSCRIWSHPKNTFEEIKKFIQHDILRSIAARTQIYCDGLADPNVGNEDLFVSEPPRRVYFDLPDSNNIQFSEYIFHGELPIVAAAQAKEMLDLDLDTEKIHADLEGLLDEDAFVIASKPLHSIGIALPTDQKDISRTMYIIGILVALLVLIISISLHFFLKK